MMTLQQTVGKMNENQRSKEEIYNALSQYISKKDKINMIHVDKVMNGGQEWIL